jgi:DNA-binding response OmpR family regulator
MGRIVVLSDRAPADRLPGLDALGLDVKVELLSPESVAHLRDLSPTLVVIDGAEDPEPAYRVLATIAASRNEAPVAVVLHERDLDAFAWEDLADELLTPEAGPREVRVRLAMLLRRTGGSAEAAVRLGQLALNVDSYQVTVAGRPLDLTYKEFELLRFLASRPNRVFTRAELLSEVWGYDFYGGTRTVDVHVRRLRAKLGPEHERLIDTVRGVGYRAAEPTSDDP